MRRICSLLILSSASLLLTGCGFTVDKSVSIAPISAGTAIHGVLMGGQQPVVGAHVYLFAPNNTGYGGNGIAATTSNASISMLNLGVLANNPDNSGVDSASDYYVTTDANGMFSISGDYSCAVGNQQGGGSVLLPADQPVYLYAVGGNPGAGTNSEAGFLAALGPCDSLSSSTSVEVNEVTTIAMAYAVAGFATDATHISSSSSALALTNIANAFANTTNLVDLPTGNALATTPAGNGTVPQAELYTLANVLGSCVNSTGSDTSPCFALLNTATSTGTAQGSVPTDTASAAINIAHHPGSNVPALFYLASGKPAFGGGLSKQPGDFTVTLVFIGGGLSGPTDIAIDAEGDAWMANPYNASISELSSSGTPVSPSAGYVDPSIIEPVSIAIDTTGSVWIADVDYALKLSSSGVVTRMSGYLISPTEVAIDAAGHIWMTESSSSGVDELDTEGNVYSPDGGFDEGGSYSPETDPIGLAFDASTDLWIANSGTNNLTELNDSAQFISPSNSLDQGGGLSSPAQVAIDPSGNVWLTNKTGTVSEFSKAGHAISSSTGYTSGLDSPLSGLAIDGGGNIWVSSGSNIAELSNSGTVLSPTNGYSPTGLATSSGMAVDGAGDVWVTDYDDNSVSEVVGAATPVVTPLIANLVSPYSHPASRP